MSGAVELIFKGVELVSRGVELISRLVSRGGAGMELVSHNRHTLCNENLIFQALSPCFDTVQKKLGSMTPRKIIFKPSS